jgi:hypothetical protein
MRDAIVLWVFGVPLTVVFLATVVTSAAVLSIM